VLRDYRWKNIWPLVLGQVAAIRGHRLTDHHKARRLSSERERPPEESRIKSELQAADLVEKQRLIDSLSRQLTKQQQIIDDNQQFMTKQQQINDENQQVIARQEQVITERKQVIESLRAQLSNTQGELFKITNSLGWRLLSRYGRIKYSLLHVYRLLGRLRKQDRKKRGDPSDTVEEADA
jgi:phage gpG-like protein